MRKTITFLMPRTTRWLLLPLAATFLPRSHFFAVMQWLVLLAVAWLVIERMPSFSRRLELREGRELLSIAGGQLATLGAVMCVVATGITRLATLLLSGKALGAVIAAALTGAIMYAGDMPWLSDQISDLGSATEAATAPHHP